MSDYVISEELYLLIRSDLYNNGYIDRYHQLKRQSRPLSAELKVERERVLNELKTFGMSFNSHLYYEELLEKIESLRSEQP